MNGMPQKKYAEILFGEVDDIVGCAHCFENRAGERDAQKHKQEARHQRDNGDGRDRFPHRIVIFLA